MTLCVVFACEQYQILMKFIESLEHSTPADKETAVVSVCRLHYQVITQLYTSLLF